MKKANIHEAKTHLSEMLAQVRENGETYLICKNGKPIAELVPHEKRDALKPHPVMKKIRIKYDPTESLTDDEWPEEED